MHCLVGCAAIGVAGCLASSSPSAMRDKFTDLRRSLLQGNSHALKKHLIL
jgi:hypothetical protein